MKTSKKKPLKAVGGLLVLLLAGIIFFFTYYQVDEVQVMGSSHYSEKQIRKMVLRGPLASNSVLAPLLYTKQNTKDVPFIEGYTVFLWKDPRNVTKKSRFLTGSKSKK